MADRFQENLTSEQKRLLIKLREKNLINKAKMKCFISKEKRIDIDCNKCILNKKRFK